MLLTRFRRTAEIIGTIAEGASGKVPDNAARPTLSLATFQQFSQSYPRMIVPLYALWLYPIGIKL